MTRAVYDCNVVLSGIGWSGSARACLKLIALRRVFAFVTPEILQEYEAVIPKTLAEELPEIDPAPKLSWIREKCTLISAVDLGKPRSRDAKDDMYLAAALAAEAKYLITYDKDLLDLGKPFGITPIRPAMFLRKLSES